MVNSSLVAVKVPRNTSKQPHLRNIAHSCSCLPYQGPERFVREIVPRARRLRAEIVLSLSLCQRYERKELESEVDRFLNSRLVLVNLDRVLTKEEENGYVAFHGDPVQSNVHFTQILTQNHYKTKFLHLNSNKFIIIFNFCKHVFV